VANAAAFALARRWDDTATPPPQTTPGLAGASPQPAAAHLSLQAAPLPHTAFATSTASCAASFSLAHLSPAPEAATDGSAAVYHSQEAAIYE
jgi:hypothetical protein